MSRFVNLSILGPRAIEAEYTDDFDSLIENMKNHWKRQLENVLCNKPDIIILPEACDRYPNFTLEQRFNYYEARGERILDFFKEVAKTNKCYIVYSAARRLEDSTYRNSSQLIDRKGNVVGIYNKNHLVKTEITDGKMLCGKDAPIFECDFGKVACAICFDLNFEELLKKYEASQPEIILFSSMYHGNYVQKVWAYNCRSYFAGAVCAQPCRVLNPVGEEIAHSSNYYDYLNTTINLDYKVIHLDFNWDKIHAAKQKYGEKVCISDPGFVGAVLIECLADDMTIDDIIKEFDFTLLDDYFNEALEYRKNNIEP